MINTIIDSRPKSDLPILARRSLSELVLNRKPGYSWTKGIHLYSELRPSRDLRAAESDLIAEQFLSTIEDYAQAGLEAATLFGFELLELQGTVLHFHKEGEIHAVASEAVQFSYVFTKVLYETLATELSEGWQGFAICMDYGEAILLHHGELSSSSTISLGPVANRPAKRLLNGRTPAGHAEIPGKWAAALLRKPVTTEWYAINLRDVEKLNFLSSQENSTLESQLRTSILSSRMNRALLASAAPPFQLIHANQLIDQGNFSTDKPLRMTASCVRADLNGFSAMVEGAFKQGDEYVEAVARDFKRLLDFGDDFVNRHYGVVRLPWAGDCVNFLIPTPTDVGKFRGVGWIDFVEEWQSFGASSDAGRHHKWGPRFKNVSWAIGMSYGEEGQSLVAQIQTRYRSFLIASGAPIFLAYSAQELGEGNEAVIHESDYKSAYPAVRKQFHKVLGTEFWRACKLSRAAVNRAVLNDGKAENTSSISPIENGCSTLSIPRPRPYGK